MQKITVRLDKNYGSWVVYPVCQQAQLFAAIAGTKTLKEKTLDQIMQLGYEIQVSPDQIKWQVAA
jgi:hypothetical protein